MTPPRRVERKQVQKEPQIIWNQYVNLLAMSEYNDLSLRQRPAQLVFWYWNEVENGGHLQYFENQGIERATVAVEALKVLGAECHAGILIRALVQYNSRTRPVIESIEEFSEAELEGEFEPFDRDYAECRPELDEVLERFLAEYQADFVVIEH